MCVSLANLSTVCVCTNTYRCARAVLLCTVVLLGEGNPLPPPFCRPARPFAVLKGVTCGFGSDPPPPPSFSLSLPRNLPSVHTSMIQYVRRHGGRAQHAWRLPADAAEGLGLRNSPTLRSRHKKLPSRYLSFSVRAKITCPRPWACYCCSSDGDRTDNLFEFSSQRRECAWLMARALSVSLYTFAALVARPARNAEPLGLGWTHPCGSDVPQKRAAAYARSEVCTAQR